MKERALPPPPGQRARGAQPECSSRAELRNIQSSRGGAPNLFGRGRANVMAGEGYSVWSPQAELVGGARCGRFTLIGRRFGRVKLSREHGWPSSAPKSRRSFGCFPNSKSRCVRHSGRCRVQDRRPTAARIARVTSTSSARRTSRASCGSGQASGASLKARAPPNERCATFFWSVAVRHALAAVVLLACVGLCVTCGGSVTTPLSPIDLSNDATTITFSGLAANGGSVSTYTEAGLNLSTMSGDWTARTDYGHPAPFIQFNAANGTTATGEIQVRAAGSMYFKSVDLYSMHHPDSIHDHRPQKRQRRVHDRGYAAEHVR